MEVEKELEGNEENIPEEVSEAEVVLQEIDVNNLAKETAVHGHKHVGREHHKKGSEEAKSLIEEVEELKEQVLRRRAEFENYRKRVELEKQEFSKYAQEKTLADLLVILDSFDRAMKPVDNDTEEAKKIFSGFSLIHKQFVDFLIKQGVMEINAIGQKFNPEFHQAVSAEASEEMGSGFVIKEYQKGYMFHKRVLRPAMVVVVE